MDVRDILVVLCLPQWVFGYSVVSLACLSRCQGYSVDIWLVLVGVVMVLGLVKSGFAEI